MVQINSDASQVDINQAVRALKKSIAAVLEEKPAEPGIKPSVPGWEPANPSVTPTQPGGEPQKPGADPQEPGGEPEKPSEEPAPEEQAEKLKITKLTISRAGGTAQAGDNISISVRSSGGTGVIKYRFLVKKNASSAIIKNDSIFRFAAWKPKEAGTYSIIVYAVDEEGRTAQKTISNYVINSRLQVKSFKVSPSSKKARAGEKVQLAVKASGGTKKYQYKYAYKKSGTKKINTIKNYSSKRTVNWRPKKSGKYTLYVYVRDKTTKRTVKKTVRNYIVGKI